MVYRVLAFVAAAAVLVPAVAAGQSPAGDEGEPAQYEPPRTPWGAPDMQGIWTLNDAHGIPFERADEDAGKTLLTEDEALARRERTTLRSIWGYDREWRDTALGFVRTAPSRQVAVIIDPPDGKLPPMTPAARERVPVMLAERRAVELAAENPEDLGSWERCATRGLPALMVPNGYNNGVQIVQGPGYVAVTKEMIHETRIIPTDGRGHLGENLTPVAGRPGRPLGGRHAGRGGHELQRQGRLVPWGQREHAADRAVHARQRGHDRVRVHGRRSHRVDAALDRHVADEAG